MIYKSSDNGELRAGIHETVYQPHDIMKLDDGVVYQFHDIVGLPHDSWCKSRGAAFVLSSLGRVEGR